MNSLLHPLVLLTFSPLLGVLVLLFIREENKIVTRWVALVSSLLSFGISIWVLSLFKQAEGGLQLVIKQPWFQVGGMQVTFFLGVDGISLLMILLTAFLTPLAILSTWSAITERVKGFMIFFLLLEMSMLGVFLALDLMLFY